MNKNYKGIFSLSFTFLLFICLFLFSSQISTIIDTKIIILNNNKHIGFMTKKDTASFTFKILNISSKEREIKHITVDCSCSELKEYSKVIKPFSVYNLTLEADNSDEKSGNQQRSAFIELKGVEIPIVVTMKYKIQN